MSSDQFLASSQRRNCRTIIWYLLRWSLIGWRSERECWSRPADPTQHFVVVFFFALEAASSAALPIFSDDYTRVTLFSDEKMEQSSGRRSLPFTWLEKLSRVHYNFGPGDGGRCPSDNLGLSLLIFRSSSWSSAAQRTVVSADEMLMREWPN